MNKPKYSELLLEVGNDERFLDLLSSNDLSDEEVVELITYPSDYMDRLNRFLIESHARKLVSYYKKYLNTVLSFDVALKMICDK